MAKIENEKKYIIAVIIPDGMADEHIVELENKTPMQVADKPVMNFLAENGICGYVQNVPDGMVPESDTANMSVLGFNPKIYSKGRSPLEAVSMNLEMRENDLAIRCNLVTVTEEEKFYEEKVILDHSADEITTEEARELILYLDSKLGTDKIRFNTGISYRHCLLWEDSPGLYDFARPHNILFKKIKDYLPAGNIGNPYRNLMQESYNLLNNHEINKKRREKGIKPANSIWLWSPGHKMNLPNFNEKYNLKGSVISAVDLIKGIAICAGMKSVDVDGATGNFHTNYKGKAEQAIKEIEQGANFVFIHIEAPDECGHRGELENKIKSIELIDRYVVKTIYDYLTLNFNNGEYNFKMLILPDHPTPIKKFTHTNAPVPFLLYSSSAASNKSDVKNFCEDEVKTKSDLYIPHGHDLLDFLFKQK